MSQYICGLAPVLLALPLLLMLLVLGMGAASLFHELSPGMVSWRRRAALAGLVIQGVLGFFMVSIYTFGFFWSRVLDRAPWFRGHDDWYLVQLTSSSVG